MKTCAKTSKYRNAGTGIEVVFSKILPAEPRKEYILMYCTTLQYR
jgi:BarA-like signal transduction histidine kinase